MSLIMYRDVKEAMRLIKDMSIGHETRQIQVVTLVK